MARSIAYSSFVLSSRLSLIGASSSLSLVDKAVGYRRDIPHKALSLIGPVVMLKVCVQKLQRLRDIPIGRSCNEIYG